MIFPLSVVFPFVCVIPPLKVNVSSVLLPSVSVPVVPNVTEFVTVVAALNVMSKLMTEWSVVLLIVTAVTSLLNVTASAVSAVFFISIVVAFMGTLKIASAFVLINVSVFAMSFPFSVPSAVNPPALVCIDILLNVVVFANLRVCPVVSVELNRTIPPFALNVVYEKSASEEKFVLPEDAVSFAGVVSVAVELPYVPLKVILPEEPLISPSFVTFPPNVTVPSVPVIVPPAETVTAPLKTVVVVLHVIPPLFVVSPNVTAPSEAVIFPLFVTAPVNCAGCEPSLISPELSVVPTTFRAELLVCISSVLFVPVVNVPFILNVPLTLSTDVVPVSGSVTLLNGCSFVVRVSSASADELNTTVPLFAVNVVYEKSASEEKYVLPLEDAVSSAVALVELPYVPLKVISPEAPMIFPSFVTFSRNFIAPLSPVIVPLLVTVDLNSAVPSVPVIVPPAETVTAPLKIVVVVLHVIPPLFTVSSNETAPLPPVIVPPAKTVTAPLYDCVPAVTAPPSKTVVSPYTVNEPNCASNFPFTVQFEKMPSFPTERLCAVPSVIICESEFFPNVTVCAAPPEACGVVFAVSVASA